MIHSSWYNYNRNYCRLDKGMSRSNTLQRDQTIHLNNFTRKKSLEVRILADKMSTNRKCQCNLDNYLYNLSRFYLNHIHKNFIRIHLCKYLSLFEINSQYYSSNNMLVICIFGKEGDN